MYIQIQAQLGQELSIFIKPVLSDRAQGRFGFEIQQQAGSDIFVPLDHFETDEFAVFNALLYFVVVGIHTPALLRQQRSAKLAPIRQMVDFCSLFLRVHVTCTM